MKLNLSFIASNHIEMLTFDIFWHKYKNGESNEVDLADSIEFMKWMHFCAMFDVQLDQDEQFRETTTYQDGRVATSSKPS